MARQGKIARLPHHLRKDVNQRLRNNEPATALLEWLNAQPDAIEIWNEWWDGAVATPQNLSEWRLGGYRDWLRQEEKVEDAKSRAEWAFRLAQATGSSTAGGAAAIAAGRILDEIENAEEDKLDAFVLSIARLRQGDQRERKLTLDERKADQKDRELALAEEKFELQTVDSFMKFAGTKEAQAILYSNKPKNIVTAELRKLIFGDRKETLIDV